MSHTYVSELIHVVFSTKGRQNSIPRDTLNRLGSFLGGIARNNGFKTIAIGGTENHVHVLLSLPATMPLARSEEHTSELQSQSNLVCRLLLEKKKKKIKTNTLYNTTI